MERGFDPDNIIHSTEVLAVNGQLYKVETYRYTQIFLNPSHPDDGNIGVLVATKGVGSVGIGSPDIRNVLQMHFPPSALDFVQEIFRAGCVHPLVPETYSYVLYYSIEIFFYIFKRSCDPNETYIDNSFCQEVVKDIFEMATLLVLAPTCYYVVTEVMFGNPHVQHNPALHSDCVIYTYFRNERIFPSLWLAGVEEVIFNIFYPGSDDNNIADDLGPWTLEVLVKGTRIYPFVRWKLFQ